MYVAKLRDDFGDLLKSLNLNGAGIEIGVGLGKFSRILVEKSDLRKIYLLDAWKEFPKDEYQDISNKAQAEQDARYESVVRLFEPNKDRVEIIRDDCTCAVNKFEDGFFDFIYIDANHEYAHVKRDILQWYPKSRSGGVFSGHDYMDGIKRSGVYGVKSAVDEFCKTIGVIPTITGGTRRCPPSWYFIKP